MGYLMITFKGFLAENMDKIRAIKAADLNKFNKALAPYVYALKGRPTQKTTTVVVKSAGSDRKNVKAEIEAKLKKARLDSIAIPGSSSVGSTGATDIMFGAHKIRIIYKPTSGGMNETTLNATITELAPALAYMSGKKKFRNASEFQQFLMSAKDNGVYVNDKDAKAGKAYVEIFPTSSKYTEKMDNAMAVLNYLWEEHAKSSIKQVYWGYRAKPKGVMPSHKGDLFIEYTSGSMLGVSLKAGGAKTSEPQLNTYVNKVFDDFGYSSKKEVLKKRVYDEIHSKIDLPINWTSRSEKITSISKIESLKEKDPNRYNALYDNMLDVVRNGLIDTFNTSKDDTIQYIKKMVIKKDEQVPLVVVKAIGKKFKFVTDEDAIETFIPKVTKINAYKSTSSKQDWFVDLIAGRETITMKMSVRTNKVPPDNKIAQDFNLAVKFNGIK